MVKPLISIVIPTYNREKLILATLQSIICQTYSNWECIIVDDGSTDNSVEIISQFIANDDRFQFLSRPSTQLKGPNSCRNYGFEKSKGDIINWFDSDDIYLPTALEEYQKAFDKNTDIVVGKVQKVDLRNKVLLGENKISSDNIIEDYFTGKIAFFVCGPMWQRKFLEQHTVLFDETISTLDDWDFNLRMLYSNPQIKYLSRSFIQYRFHQNSLSGELLKFNFEEIDSEFRARNKHLRLLDGNPKVNKKILLTFVKDRYKFFFRDAVIRNHSKKQYLLRKLLVSQLAVNDFVGIAKSLFGYCFYSMFKKGYILLK